MAKSNEPFWWGLFGAGGMIAALLMPITILITSLGVVTGMVTEERLWNVIHNPFGKLYFFLLISLSLFHAAHRFRFTVVDLVHSLKAFTGLIAVVFYGIAIAGTLVTLVLLFQV